MATVSVFVDEAVRGRLPMVCAKTGQPADLLVRTTQSVGGLPGAAWLLVFLGPPGWGILLLLALFGSGQESLTARIPAPTPASSGSTRCGATCGSPP